MKKRVNFEVTCPECGEEIVVTHEIDETPVAEPSDPVYPPGSFPEVRDKNLKPAGNILVYKITSEQIKDFIIRKAKMYVPDIRMTVVPRYCEKKRKSPSEPHRSYASLRIAFSHNVVEKKADYGWYGNIGENSSNVKLHKDIMEKIIDMYKYNPKDIESWQKNYKTLEELEEGLGMTAAYISDLRMYATPQRVKTENNETWIIFAAAAENVIADMLTEKNTGKLPGRLQIADVSPISKDIVEFVVHIHPAQMKTTINPNVRKILLGEEKPKK